jgi:hypothetical protein
VDTGRRVGSAPPFALREPLPEGDTGLALKSEDGDMPAAKRAQYRKKANQYVVAVRLDLETDGIVYKKWGDTQRAKRGDWLVDNAGDVYTVDAEVFARTYEQVVAGVYIKTSSVWAEVAAQSGSVQTKEGRSHYAQGDYIVSNNENGDDAYCMSAEKFEEMYTRSDT